MKDKNPNLVKLGQNIRDARKAKGFSQEDFAGEVGMGRTYMGRVERGEQNISIQNLIEIALILKIEVGDLVPELRSLKSLYDI
jgi:transcriptional regulator with XRE-family HTH domain